MQSERDIFRSNLDKELEDLRIKHQKDVESAEQNENRFCKQSSLLYILFLVELQIQFLELEER